MKKASLVSIGNELLSGQTVDSNAAFLSAKLLAVGIPVVSCYTVGDDIDSIADKLKLASKDGDIVLMTGGLGPTDDDVTRQGLAKLLGTQLQLQEELLEKIDSYFASRGLQMPAKSKAQAYIPAGTKAIANNLGSAPGIMAELQNKLFIALPGVPSEMKGMFEESVLAHLTELVAKQGQVAIAVGKVKCFGASEAKIAELLGSMMERGRNPLINCTVAFGTITLHITATAKDAKLAQRLVQKEKKTLIDLLGAGDLVYGTGEQTLAEVVGENLTKQGKTIAVAESCTGGTLAKQLTDLPGASRYFTHGWVTYSNAAKTTQLGVPQDLIDEFGAVSEQVAEAMAKCARKRADTSVAIGITGIAGPDGGNADKPVGLVYISVDSEGESETKRFIFPRGRDAVRILASQTALNMLRLKLG